MKKYLFIMCAFIISTMGVVEGSLAVTENTSSKIGPFIHHGGLLPGPRPTNNDFTSEYAEDFAKKKFLPQLINFLITTILSIGVLVFIVGGILFITSFDNSERYTKARDAIIWGLIGIIIAILAYTIVKIIIGVDFWG